MSKRKKNNLIFAVLFFIIIGVITFLIAKI